MVFEVRFAAVKVGDRSQPAASTQPPPATNSTRARRRNPKSHHGCRECKLRRVKCDETLPACLRCQKRGSICHSDARPSTWQLESPGLLLLSSSPRRQLAPYRLDQKTHVNSKLLQRWFERTSFILVLNPETNPLAFPIISQLESSSSLVHALQSICAGHETFFERPEQGMCLQERGRALKSFRLELEADQTPQFLRFWTCYLLGVSASYISHENLDYGKEHLFAAHQIVAQILRDIKSQDHESIQHILGAYAYWDLSCAMLIDPAEQPPRDPIILESILTMMGNFDHCITGRFTDLFCFLGGVGRYCRRVADGYPRDPVFEVTVETKLVNWNIASSDEQWIKTAEIFRAHGLILLYRVYGLKEQKQPSIRDLSQRLIHFALEIRPTSNFVSVQGQPLLSAASELTMEDIGLRESVRARYKEIFSYNHLPGSMRAVWLLEEVWALKDRGSDTYWLQLMLEKTLRLRLE